MEINYKEIVAPHFYGISCDIFRQKYTHYYFSGGRGSGKSSKIPVDCIILLMQNPDVNMLALRKVGATLRDSVYNQLLWAIGVLQVPHLFKATVSPMEITYLKTGQKIFFRGADDPVKIKSIKPKMGYIGIVWFEELDSFHGMEEIRSILQSANRGGDKYWNFYSFNPPKSRHHWVNGLQLDLPCLDTIFHHSTYETMPREWLGEQFFMAAESLRRQNPVAYENEYLGVATGVGGQIFDNIVERTITNEEMRRFDRLKFGIDFGFSADSFAWIKIHFNSSRKILYILDEIYETNLSNGAAVEAIRRKHHGFMLNIADSEDARTINEFRLLGLNIQGAVKGADSVRHGIKFLQDLTEIVIDKSRTPNAYREFNLYEYEKNRNGEYISSYPDKNCHTIDAVRYAMESEMRQSQVYTSNYRL